jgi:hypothetical protein
MQTAAEIAGLLDTKELITNDYLCANLKKRDQINILDHCALAKLESPKLFELLDNKIE